MYFDRPGLILLVSLATVGPLAGLAISRWMNDYKTPTGWDAWFTLITLLAIDFLNGLVISAWIAQMYDEYKKVNGDAPKRTAESEEKRGALIVNTGNMIYPFQASSLKIDARRHFAIQQWRVLEYHNHDAKKLDWTETYWLKAKPRKWKGKNEEFRVMMHDIDGTVIEKADPNRPNSGYTLRDENMLHRMAQGTLPH